MQESVTPQTTTASGLTQFQEAANEIQTQITLPEKLTMIATPFPNPTPTALLTRAYQLPDISWTPAYAGSTILFPDVLLGFQTLANALYPFKYMRTGVKIVIRLNSTPYHQGALVVGWLPSINNSTVPNVAQLCACNSVILSASTQDSATIRIPYVNPAAWFQINPFTANAVVARLYIQQLSTLITTSPGIPASVPITMFVSFDEPEVAGYYQPVQAQSTRGTSRFGLDQTKYPKPIDSKPNEEARDKKRDGLDARAIIRGVSAIVKKIPFLNTILSPITFFVDLLDLDYPTSNEVAHPQIYAPTRGFSQLSGLSSAETISMYPNPTLSTENFGMETSRMSVSALANRPMLYGNTQFYNPGDNWVTTVFPTSFSPIYDYSGSPVQSSDYLQFCAAPFSYWRGSIKFLLHFVSSAFYSARFQIYYSNGAVSSPNGDLLQTVIDVKGDTFTEFTVPYLFPNYWQPLADNSYAPALVVRMITPIVGSSLPSTPTIYLNVFRAGGEDTQFSLLGNAAYLPYDYDNPVTAQSSINSRFKQVFPSLIEGSNMSQELKSVMSEQIGTIKDCTMRASSINANVTAFDYPSVTGETSDTQLLSREPFNYWSSVFAFWRGGRRIRQYYGSPFGGTAPTARVSTPSDLTTFGNTQFPVALDTTMTFPTWEVPWYHTSPYFFVPSYGGIDLSQVPPVNLVLGATFPITIISGSDDFEYLFVTPPFPVYRTASTGKPPPASTSLVTIKKE